jgi:hypothetical protein
MATSSLVWSLKISQTGGSKLRNQSKLLWTSLAHKLCFKFAYSESILATRQNDLNEQNIRLQSLEATLSLACVTLAEKTRKLHELQASISNLVVASDSAQASLAAVEQRHGLCIERISMQV